MNPTSRRKVVLGLTLLGFTCVSIATQLGYSESTIRGDLSALYRTFRVTRNAQLIRAAWL